MTERDFEHASDEVLVRAYMSGNEEAFTALYNRYRAPLRRFLAARCGSRENAVDIAQTTWMKFIDVLTQGSYDASRPFAPFLYTIARNKAIDGLRGQKHLVDLDDLAEEQRAVAVDPVGRIDPEQLLSDAEAGRALNDCLDKLHPAQKEAWLLYADADLRYDDIAEITDAPRETVKTRLRYARLHLRECLAGKGFAPLSPAREKPSERDDQEQPAS